MRVLDLDLDFFVSPLPAGGASKHHFAGRRRSDAVYTPWSAERFTRYLERRLGLSAASPTPGALLTHHDAAYRAWRRQIAAGALRTPFDVVPIDAHGDLGMEHAHYPAFAEIERDLRGRPPGWRAPRGLTRGNYLLFAAAGWVRRLTYVLHEELRVPDLPMSRSFWPTRPARIEPRGRAENLTLVLEPREHPPSGESRSRVRVPLRIQPVRTYRTARQFDFIVLAQSPEYTSRAADALIPVFERYIRRV